MAWSRRWCVGCGAAAIGFLIGAAPAAAQIASPRLTVSVGAGVAKPSMALNLPTWMISVRTQHSPHVAYEVFFTDRGALTTQFTGPYTVSSLGFNALMTGASGRLRPYVGGGGSIAFFRRQGFSSAEVAAQVVLGTDVVLTSRVLAFVQMRGFLGLEGSDTSIGDVSVIGGVRIAFR